MLRFNRLHNRIMLPFLALFLVIHVLSLLLNRHYIAIKQANLELNKNIRGLFDIEIARLFN